MFSILFTILRAPLHIYSNLTAPATKKTFYCLVSWLSWSAWAADQVSLELFSFFKQKLKGGVFSVSAFDFENKRASIGNFCHNWSKPWFGCLYQHIQVGFWMILSIFLPLLHIWRTPPSHLSLLLFSSSPLSPSAVVIPASLTCFFSLHTWTLFLACCLLLWFSKVASLPPPPRALHLLLTLSFSPLSATFFPSVLASFLLWLTSH